MDGEKGNGCESRAVTAAVCALCRMSVGESWSLGNREGRTCGSILIRERKAGRPALMSLCKVFHTEAAVSASSPNKRGRCFGVDLRNKHRKTAVTAKCCHGFFVKIGTTLLFCLKRAEPAANVIQLF